MALDLIAAKLILLEARTFYKGGEKSSNKGYIITDLDRQNLDVLGKKLNRNVNAFLPWPEATPINPRIRDHLRSLNFTIVQGGGWIRTIPYTRGNCVEMSWLVAYLINCINPNDPLNYCTINLPGDHVFISSGTPPAQIGDVRGMEGQVNDCIVIDCWANIACRWHEYPQSLIKKILDWQASGKRIFSRGAWADPQTYLVNSATGPLTLWDAKTTLCPS